MRWAFGPLGLKPKEFWRLSWPEFWHLYEGNELKRQLEWDKTRFLAAAVINGSYHRGKRAVSPQEVLHLPLVDRKAAKGEPKETPQEFIARMSRKLGKPLTLVTD
ncbi:hypothetical protein GCM10023183_08570 [Nibribacter koreensis]|uniref:Phage tail assembly chaperone n=1 Tax=Nibribacter koreensis TaxID=1084519 RepID=A0ABP8FB74_9BACT